MSKDLPKIKECDDSGDRGDSDSKNESEEVAPELETEGNPLEKIKISRAIYPVLIGLGVIAYLFYKDFEPAIFNDIHFSWSMVFWLLAALLLMFGRDFGYIVRIKVLSGDKLSWVQAFRVIMLWEFTSAITPSAVGGTSVAILYIHKEGISIGKSSAMVMLTSFLDELYFIIMFPVIVAIAGMSNLFELGADEGIISKSFMTFAIIGYVLKLAYLLILSYGLFINPRGLKWLLMKIFKWGFLKRWYRAMNNIGTDIINSSKEICRHGAGFWFKAGFSTFISWTSRYLVANALIMAFFAVSDQFLLFARQLVMWIMMLIMPTPGGSGFAEYIFSSYCADLIAVPLELQLGAATLIAFLWRGITYYPYLIIGAFVFPRWISTKFGKKKKIVR